MPHRIRVQASQADYCRHLHPQTRRPRTPYLQSTIGPVCSPPRSRRRSWPHHTRCHDKRTVTSGWPCVLHHRYDNVVTCTWELSSLCRSCNAYTVPDAPTHCVAWHGSAPFSAVTYWAGFVHSATGAPGPTLDVQRCQDYQIMQISDSATGLTAPVLYAINHVPLYLRHA